MAETSAWPEATTVPDRMSAVAFSRFSSPDALEVQEFDVPPIAPDEVLVKVGAVTLERFIDILARADRVPGFSPTLPHVLGGESAGTVVAVGAELSGVAVGDHVAVNPVIATDAGRELIGLHRWGAYGAYVAVPGPNATIVPTGISVEDACAVALSGPVAMTEILALGAVGPGTTVLVQGANSGLGATTALLARFLGAEVAVATARQDQVDNLRQLGFEHAYWSRDPDHVEQVRADLPDGADAVFHHMGTPRVWDASLGLVRAGGRIVISGAFIGAEVQLDLHELTARGISIIAVSAASAEGTAAFWEQVGRGYRTEIARRWHIVDAWKAHFRLEEGDQPPGKIIFQVPELPWPPRSF